MYPVSVASLRNESTGTTARSAAVVPRNVLFLGLTSLLTDVSSEMVTSVIPLYLMLHLQLSPAAFGAIDGLQQGAASLVRLLGGVLTDRSGHFAEAPADPDRPELDANVWASRVQASPHERPRIFVRSATSPAVVR